MACGAEVLLAAWLCPWGWLSQESAWPLSYLGGGSGVGRSAAHISGTGVLGRALLVQGSVTQMAGMEGVGVCEDKWGAPI